MPATWMVGRVLDGVSMEGDTDEGRVVVSMESTRLSSMCAGRHAVAGKKEGGGRDLRAPRAAVRDRRAILTGQSIGNDAISPPVRTFGESTRVRRRRGGAFRPRRRVDILSHVSSSEIGKRTTRGSTRPRSGSRASARSCSAAAPAACDRSCLPRISCRIAYR